MSIVHSDLSYEKKSDKIERLPGREVGSQHEKGDGQGSISKDLLFEQNPKL